MAAETAAVASAKKQLAEALAVLQKHGVVTRDDVLLVQGVVCKGVVAPLDPPLDPPLDVAAADAFAGAAAVAPGPLALSLVASAPAFVPGAPAVTAPSAADIRKAFLEKVHAAVTASITTTKKENAEEKEDGKGEAAGELLVDVSVPTAPAPAITAPLPSMVVLVPTKGPL
ncbi:hypothetical protein DL764_006904 [Monosporascus ibericus]|uniref:Uncharacterized protein n=1 Tax=Monosporascus ibericus TaxID=155417 RepID=A0A4V1X9Y3_9PEZI|nr:hypothetical protein DL764_006904 [Monosporascus ibericus]